MTKKLTVGVDVRDLKIAKTGAKTYLEELYKEFSSHTEIQFYFFTTIIPVYKGRNSFLKLIEHYRFLLWKQLVLPVKALLRGCDIVFCTDFFVPYIHLGYKTIPVFHDAFFWESPQHYNRYWLKLFKSIGVASAKRAAYIITPTDYAKKRILEYLRIDPNRIIPIPEAPKRLEDVATGSIRTNLIPNSKFILHVGTLEKRKNLTTLIKAFSLLRKNGYSNYSLIIAGQAPPKKTIDDSINIQQTIKSLNLEDQVILTGFVNNAELTHLYKNADMYVFPSDNEGFGIPVLEAFQHNIPLIIANNSCLPEVADDAALSFSPYDAEELAKKMQLIIEDSQLRKTLIEKGQERLSHFSWQKTATQLIDLFKKVSNTCQ